MAKCYNRNDAAYLALKDIYKTDLKTSQVISNWQEANDSDIFPSAVQAKSMVSDQEIVFSLKQKEFGQAVLDNVRREKIGSRLAGQFLINNSNPETLLYDESFLENNLKRFYRYLEINNIDESSFKVTRTNQSYKIEPINSAFGRRDILEKSRSWDTNRSRAVVMHLKRMFPQVNVKMLSVAEARILHESLPKYNKKDVGFDNVKSFYYNGTAYLIKGRVTDEIAIEEMLHPFIDAIKMENEELFNNLLDEAVTNFPELSEEIKDAYNNQSRNFSETERDLEIVTQALARHFKKEYETTPTKGFLDKIAELLEWFKSVIENLSEYLTGKQLPVSAIKATTSMSDIAKLLNTEGIQFKLEKRVNGNVRYNLTKQKAKELKAARAEANNVQKPILDQLYNLAQLADQEIHQFSVSEKNAAAGDTLVVLNEEDHVYYNPNKTKDIYTSATTAIKGTLPEDKQIAHKINLDIGNEIDTLLEGVIGGLSFDASFKNLTTDNVSKEKAKEVFDTLDTIIQNFKDQGSIVLSQVVLFDEATKIAGMADIFIIDEYGRVQILDLKTSKNNLDDVNDDGIRKYKVKYPLAADSKLIQYGVTELNTEAQHNLQVALYRRMIENMGYEVSYHEWSMATIHFNVGIEGYGVDQVFNGEVNYDRIYAHPISTQLDKVNKLIPISKNSAKQESLSKKQRDAYNKIWNGKDQTTETTEQDKTDAENFTEYNIAAGLLEDYMGKLIAKRDLIPLVKNSIYIQSTQKKEIDQISKTIAYIAIALSEDAGQQSVVLSEVLQDALAQIKEFRSFMEDPNNITKPEYLSYALHFEKYLETFKGLYELTDLVGLNNTQKNLILSLQTQLNALRGSKGSRGIVDDALYDYVQEQVRTKSSNNYGGEGSYFTKEDLDLVMEFAQDIDGVEYQTRDMDTSGDVMLSVMAKIRKIQTQKLLDKVAQREDIIRSLAQKLVKLNPGVPLNELYDFMLEFVDVDGVKTFSGNYVTAIGNKYNIKQDQLRSVLSDNDGTWYQYRPVFNLDDAMKTPQGRADLKYNQDLADKKAAYSQFFRAEAKDDEGRLIDGMYHKYTQEFKDVRSRYEMWNPGGSTSETGYWKRKAGIPQADWITYRARYYDRIPYTKANRVNGVADGTIQIKENSFDVPKVENREVVLEPRNGDSMSNPKYNSIMDPTKTDALSIAQREFYKMYVDMYEKDLLKKIPIGVAADMLGRAPLVMNRLLDQVSRKGTTYSKLYAKAVRSKAFNMFKTTQQQKNIQVDNQGYIINQLPIYYTGRPRTDEERESVQRDIDVLKEKYKSNKITRDEYKDKVAILNGKMAKIMATPALGQIDTDMASSLLKFSAMAENFETMGQIDDTLNAFVKVIENRTYSPAPTTGLTLLSRGKDKIISNVGTKANRTEQQKNVVRRAKKFMSMIHYDNELVTKGAFDKIADGIIQFSSLSYVAFNPFGNFNNYLIGRLNNNVESLGGRFYSNSAFKRATWEFNKRALPALVQRTAHGGAEDLLDVVTLGVIPGLAKADYNKKLPNNKYEGFVDSYRMMDSMTDIREQSSATDDGKSWFQRATEWGYIMQDAAEYNSQTKVGMAILMDYMIEDDNGNSLSLFDAMDFDTKSHKNVMKEGYHILVKKDGTKVEWSDDMRYEIRNEIREVNKQIHGNYAKEDRMVLQSHTLGALAVQFKKWVAPAIRARYQREYFDQNLGWMEGRYKSALSFINYAMREVFVNQNLHFKTMGKDYMDAQVNYYSKEKYGVERKYGEGGNMDQRAKNKLFGFYRSMGELGIMFSVMFVSMLFDRILRGDDDDSDFEKRLKNLTRYQADRAYKELVLFMPSFAGAKQIDQMANSPIASARSVTEMSEFLEMFIVGNARYGLSKVTGNEEEFLSNSSYVYQRGDRKGEFKVHKNFRDVFPIVYSIQKWKSYIKNADFYIK
tara:strand:- start:575 stop:6346 length:5772 start_codon:yes stop_codon:yes gene_type:complete